MSDFEGDEGFEELIERQVETGILDEDSDIEEADELDENSQFTQPLEDTHDDDIDQIEQKLKNINKMNKNHTKLDKTEQYVKNQILMLCSALGGIDPSSPTSEYVLGSDAYGCLKDIKSWLKRFEEQNSWLVASLCHDTGLFVNDLVPIVVQIGDIVIKDPSSSLVKVVLIALELMVKLTSPIVVVDDNEENEEQLIYFMKMKLAQVEYKHRILNYNNGQILKNVISIAIPILKMSKKDLVKRDNVILNLCITLFVNILRIEPFASFKSNTLSSKRSTNIIETIPTGVTKEDISLDKTLTLFEKFKVLTFVQTVSSNLTTEFETSILGYACMDFFYYLFSGIKPETIANFKKSINATTKASNTRNAPELSSSGQTLIELLKTEENRKRDIFAHRSTRHANFGTLLKIKDGSNKYRTVSGQSKLMNDSLLDVMDHSTSKETKRIGSHIYREKKTNRDDRLTERNISINEKSTLLLKEFTTSFLENSFNTLCKEFEKKILSSPDKDITETTVARYHYLYVMHWTLRYNSISVGSQKRTVANMKKYRYIVYAISSEVIEKLFIVYLNIYERNYPMLRMSMKCIQQIIVSAMELHSFSRLTSEQLLESDLKDVKAYVISAEGTLRVMFKSKDRIKTLCDLPRDAQKVSLAHAEMAIEFTNVLLKFFKYTQSLRVPLMLIKNKDPDADNVEYISFDQTLVNMYTNTLLQERIVSLHIWYFIRWSNFEERNIKRCLNYFLLLVNEGWEEHVFKLMRLDFMFALFNLQKSNFSRMTKMGFGRLLDRFMHLFSKMHCNTKCILLEPMTLSATNNSSIIDYYLSGDPFLDSRQERDDDRFDNEQQFVDVKFQDNQMGKSQMIALVTTRLIYDDNELIIRELIKVLDQWVKELKNEDLLEEDKIVKRNTFKLRNNTLKAAKNLPYFRLLCDIIGIKHARLVEKSVEVLQENRQLVANSVETPLDQMDLENKFYDPNTERKRYDEDRVAESDYYGEGIINDDDDDLANDSNVESDPLALLEAQLNTLEKREKGKAMKRTKDGDLVDMSRNVKRKKRTKEKIRNSKPGGNKKKKRRTLIDEGDVLLSDTEVIRRGKLSSARVEDSGDEDDLDHLFFEKERKLQIYLQKRGGKITRNDYDKLVAGELNVEELSDIENDILEIDKLAIESVMHSVEAPLSNEFVDSDADDDEEEEESEESNSSSSDESFDIELQTKDVDITSNNGSAQSSTELSETLQKISIDLKTSLASTTKYPGGIHAENEQTSEKEVTTPSVEGKMSTEINNNGLASTLLDIQHTISAKKNMK